MKKSGNELPALSMDELYQIAENRDIAPFRADMHDELPDKLKSEIYGIVNLDHDDHGTHWVCYYNRPQDDHVMYFDSFGLPPSDIIADYLKKGGKPIMYNDGFIQEMDSKACGYYCMYVLDKAKKGHTDILANLGDKRDKNEEYIKKIAKKYLM